MNQKDKLIENTILALSGNLKLEESKRIVKEGIECCGDNDNDKIELPSTTNGTAEKEINDMIERARKRSTESKLQEDQYESERRKGRPNIRKIALQEYEDNQDFYCKHLKEYKDEDEFIKKNIANIASEYNLKEDAAKEVCKQIFLWATNDVVNNHINIDGEMKTEAKENDVDERIKKAKEFKKELSELKPTTDKVEELLEDLVDKILEFCKDIKDTNFAGEDLYNEVSEVLDDPDAEERGLNTYVRSVKVNLKNMLDDFINNYKQACEDANMEESKELKEGYTARQALDARLSHYSEENKKAIKVAVETKNYILTVARDHEDENMINLRVIKGDSDSLPVPDVFIDQDYRGVCEWAKVNWAAVGDKTVEETGEFIGLLRDAINFAKQIDGKNFSDLLKESKELKEGASSNKYTITYYKNSATAERRPTTKEDIENDWIVEEKSYTTDLEAFEYAYKELLDYDDEDLNDLYEDLDDTNDDLEKVNAIKEYLEDQDLGSGETIIISIKGIGQTYDSGYSKEDFLGELDESKKVTENVDWSYFNKFDSINNKYLPASGEGDTLASQTVTAINKLIYKWYNDGDVYDNVNSGMQGWANDLSSYANWLAQYCPGAKDILDEIYECNDDHDYENLLKSLADKFLNKDFLITMEEPKQGSIYSCSGSFKFELSDYEDEY